MSSPRLGLSLPSRLALVALVAVAPSLHGQAESRVFAWGDSITSGAFDGTSAANDCSAGEPANNPSEECGYPGRLNSRLNDLAKFSPDYDVEVINLGKGGETTNEAFSRFDRASWTCPCDALAQPCRPNSIKYWICNGTLQPEDLFVLMEGTNDITNKVSVETIAENLQELGDKAEAYGLNVVISSITPRHPDGGLKSGGSFDCAHDGDNQANSLNSQINALATANTWPKVDPNGRLKSADITGMYTNYYQTWSTMRCEGGVDQGSGDPVGHPNKYGFDAIACNGTKTVACTTSGSYYSKTFESVVRRALPPRMALTSPTSPFLSGISKQFTLAICDDDADCTPATLAQSYELTWDFGDGTVETQTVTSSPVVKNHTFWAAGDFVVTVTAEHANGGQRARISPVLHVTLGDMVFADDFESGGTSNWIPGS